MMMPEKWVLEVALGLITALASLALWSVARVQLKRIGKTSNSDFIHKLNTDFYKKDETLNLLRILRNEGQIIYSFANNLPQISAVLTTPSETLRFDTVAIHEYLLNPLEMVGIYQREKIIEIKMVYEIFGPYVNMVWKNQTIREYVESKRKMAGSEDSYNCLEALYKNLQNYKP